MKNGLSAILTALLIYVNCGTGLASTSNPSKILADYIAKPDASYGYYVQRVTEKTDFSYAEIILTSQTWRQIVWKHQLYIIKPKTINSNANHMLMLIDGGRWKGADSTTAKFERSLNLFSHLANKIQMPIAVLRQVPYQPLWGMNEDKLIAHTFDKYLKTGEADWPLLLPMVKSAVKAMDAVQDFSRREWALSINAFTVTGSSKRGWTTWLTGAMDKRVAAIAPMVIDILNIERQMAHQEAVFGPGRYSEKISEYTSLGLHRQINTPAGQTLQNMVDPHRYLANLTLPKLIILGTNDRYWTLDALNLYWNDLRGPKYVLYVPNEGHSLKDYKKVFGTINAFHQHAALGAPLPKLSWETAVTKETLSLRVKSDFSPSRVLAWVAYSPVKDFREAEWSSKSVRKKGNEFIYSLSIPKDQCVAVFLEMEYEADMPYYFSTNVQIAGKPGCAAMP